MKKLMIAAAIVCAAAFAQAASVTWSTGLLTDQNGTSLGKGSIGDKWTAVMYVYAAADTEYTTALVQDSVTMEYIDSKGKATASYSGADGASVKKWNTTTGLTVTKEYGDLDDTTPYQYKLIVYEGTAEDYTAFKEYGPAEVSTVGATGSATWTTDAAFVSADWQTVPEPTSAMLLLLGVAGLALKRKRA